MKLDRNENANGRAKDALPPMRIIREGGSAERCEICGSSMRRAWFGFGRIIGCLQPKCWNWYGYKNLPAARNRSLDLYGAPKRPSPPPPPPTLQPKTRTVVITVDAVNGDKTAIDAEITLHLDGAKPEFVTLRVGDQIGIPIKEIPS